MVVVVVVEEEEEEEEEGRGCIALNLCGVCAIGYTSITCVTELN